MPPPAPFLSYWAFPSKPEEDIRKPWLVEQFSLSVRWCVNLEIPLACPQTHLLGVTGLQCYCDQLHRPRTALRAILVSMPWKVAPHAKRELPRLVFHGLWKQDTEYVGHSPHLETNLTGVSVSNKSFWTCINVVVLTLSPTMVKRKSNATRYALKSGLCKITPPTLCPSRAVFDAK